MVSIDLIQVGKSDQQSFQNMSAVFGFIQIKLGAAGDDFHAMINKICSMRRNGKLRGSLSTRASIFTPKVDCNWVYLKTGLTLAAAVHRALIR